MNGAVRRFFFLVFCVLSGAAGLDAQHAAVFQHPLSAETLPRYTAVCAVLGSRPYTKGSFEQTKTIGRLNRSLISRGKFIIAAELGMVWDTQSPFPSLMAVGRDFIVQSLPGGGKTKIDAAGNETFVSLASALNAIFTGNAAALEEQFDRFFVGEKPPGTLWTIGLRPREKAVRLFAEEITLSGDGLLRSIVIYERDGGSTAYALSNHLFPPELESGELSLFSPE
jgi:hypothetical protein